MLTHRCFVGDSPESSHTVNGISVYGVYLLIPINYKLTRIFNIINNTHSKKQYSLQLSISLNAYNFLNSHLLTCISRVLKIILHTLVSSLSSPLYTRNFLATLKQIVKLYIICGFYLMLHCILNLFNLSKIFTLMKLLCNNGYFTFILNNIVKPYNMIYTTKIKSITTRGE